MKGFVFVVALVVFVLCGREVLLYKPWEWAWVVANTASLKIAWYALGQPVVAVLYMAGTIISFACMMLAALTPKG